MFSADIGRFVDCLKWYFCAAGFFCHNHCIGSDWSLSEISRAVVWRDNKRSAKVCEDLVQVMVVLLPILFWNKIVSKIWNKANQNPKSWTAYSLYLTGAAAYVYGYARKMTSTHGMHGTNMSTSPICTSVNPWRGRWVPSSSWIVSFSTVDSMLYFRTWALMISLHLSPQISTGGHFILQWS